MVGAVAIITYRRVGVVFKCDFVVEIDEHTMVE